MKKYTYLFILLIALSACKDDVLKTGSSVLPQSDEIVVSVDTFGVKSSLHEGEYIYASSPDSMMLGECDTKFGTIHADILTQLACPEGYEYETGAEVDSVLIYLTYSSWFGEDSTVVAERDKIVIAASSGDSTQVGYVISFKATDSFAKRFFEKQDFSSQEAYSEQMKGLYVTTNFGSASILHVKDINLAVFYHYTYQRLGNDTTVSNERWFYANSEVRTINHICYTNSTFEDLSKKQDSVSYIVSPASMYTSLSIPMKAMADTILLKDEMQNKRPYVNMAQLKIDVLNVYSGQTSQKTSDDWAQPATYMLLLKQSAAERFFSKKEVPSDTCAILSSLLTGTDSIGNTTYYYRYDLSSLLTNQLRQKEEMDTLRMYLVPVTVDFSSSSSTTVRAVHQMNTMSATEIRSAQDKTSPMRLEVVCSGF